MNHRMLKTVRAFIPVLITALILPVILAAVCGAAHADSEKSYVVGANKRFGAYSASGGYLGAGSEYLDKISSISFNRFSYTSDTPENLFRKLLDGTVDIIPCVTESELGKYEKHITGSDEQTLTLVPLPLFAKYSTITVYKNGASGNTEFGNEYQINKMTIGYLAEDKTDFFINGRFVCKELRDAKFISYDTEEELQADLQSGKTDAAAKTCFIHWLDEKVIYTFNLEPCYFAIRAKNTALIEDLTQGLSDILAYSPNFSGDLYEKYISNYGTVEFSFTKSEQDYITNNKKLTVAYNLAADYSHCWDENANALTGTAAKVFKELENATGFSVEVVAYDDIIRCLRQLTDGKVNMVFGGVSPDGITDYSGCFISSPVTQSPLVMLTNKDKNDDDVSAVTIVGANVGIKNALAKFYPGAKVTPFTSAEIAADRLKSDTYDAFCTSTNTAVYLLSREKNDLKFMRTLPVSVSECFAVNKAQPDLYSVIEKTLSRINRSVSGAETQDIISSLENAKPRESPYPMMIITAFSAAAVLVVGGMILTSIENHRRLEIDPLTGGRNKRRFIKDSEKAAKKLDADQLALAVIDIDKFKFVNDRLGYEEGNRILTRLHNTISDALEKGEVFSRISDDNFAMMVHNSSDLELETRLGAIYAEFNRRNSRHTSVQLTFSAGICRLGQCRQKFGTVDINAAIDRCNIARKAIKERRGNSIAFFDGKIREKELREKDYENEMPQALKNGEFACYLQPKYGTRSRHIEGAEALIRWKSKEFGFVYPNDFIPLSERNGFVVDLDFFILEEVCRLMRKWLDSGITPVVISVNQSRLHLDEPDYIGKLREIVDKYEIPYKYIELELTESVFTEDAELMIKTMQKLHDVGFKLSIDDFGSGYSSLNMLKDMPADVVKIDREFFNTTANSEKGRAVISSVVDLANKLDMRVISEGVETEEQVEFLSEIGCHMVQGYFFAKPMTIKDFEKLWETDRSDKNDQEVTSDEN